MNMNGGILQVLLVAAKDFKDNVLLGKKHKAWWNEKFIFELPSTTRKSSKLSLKIMEKDKFKGDIFIGETTVYLQGIINEGKQQGKKETMLAAYNIVLPNGDYKGEIKIGLKFISNARRRISTERWGKSRRRPRQENKVYL
ncbi:hypothetical protein ZOSMA_25G00510 [Zostera marina]|uniref:C2 domain-containing protein n=1 Tax=Zostera marina TaxID=29655 RepID=A0A0K9PFC8_ZOSMR|nr:hypothetical protein ZOSMA_25G00510 [Zostera marina]